MTNTPRAEKIKLIENALDASYISETNVYHLGGGVVIKGEALHRIVDEGVQRGREKEREELREKVEKMLTITMIGVEDDGYDISTKYVPQKQLFNLLTTPPESGEQEETGESDDYRRGYERALEYAVELAEKIEREEPDGGTAEWKAFKHLRNKLRDSLRRGGGEK